MDISKLDAAKRQLDTAISLYFKDADPVSIHTLTAAAHQILMDISKAEGVRSLVKDSLLDIIKKDGMKKYLSLVNKAENYFKHAKKDARALLQFNPEQTVILLFDAVELYMQYTKEKPDDMFIYRLWFLCKHPEFFSDEIKNEIKNKNINIANFAKNTKLSFYAKMKDALFCI